MSQKPPPVVVWRDNLPYRCTMTYWGRRWTLNRIWPFLHHCHVWTAHSPIHGPENVQYSGTGDGSTHTVTFVADDGRFLQLHGETRHCPDPVPEVD